jgi:hypothetical protein
LFLKQTFDSLKTQLNNNKLSHQGEIQTVGSNFWEWPWLDVENYYKFFLVILAKILWLIKKYCLVDHIYYLFSY